MTRTHWLKASLTPREPILFGILYPLVLRGGPAFLCHTLPVLRPLTTTSVLLGDGSSGRLSLREATSFGEFTGPTAWEPATHPIT